MDALVRDFRYAARAFLRSPGFWAVAAITLALGIGANTAILSLVHTVLLKPLPYRDPSRLIVAWDTYLPQDKLLPMFPKIGVAPPELELWQQQHDVFEDTAWYRYVPYEMALSAPGAEALSIHAGFCSTNFLRVLGAPPALGRTFADDEPPNSALISGHLWRTHFAADPGVAGRTVRLNDDIFTVIGIMPAGFSFPDWADLWLPPGPLYGDELTNPVRHAMGFIGRLNPNVTTQQASTRLSAGGVSEIADRSCSGGNSIGCPRNSRVGSSHDGSGRGRIGRNAALDHVVTGRVCGSRDGAHPRGHLRGRVLVGNTAHA